MSLKQLPLRLKLLISAQAIGAVICFVLFSRDPAPVRLDLLLGLVMLGALAGACKVDVSGGRGWITLGFTVAYMAFLLLGVAPAMVVGVAATLAGSFVVKTETAIRLDPRKPFTYRSLYNVATCITSTAVMGWIYQRQGGSFGRIELSTTALPVLLSALGYYLYNTGTVSLAIAWTQSVAAFAVWRQHFVWAWPGFVASASISAVMLWGFQAFRMGPAWLLALPPAALIYYYMNIREEKQRSDGSHMRELNRLNDAIIACLASAIDAKDRHTHAHTIRVREYATMLAERLSLSGDEQRAVRAASLLHDIGKIGIPEAILCKPGRLTSEEFEIIKTHVDIGAAILEQVQFPWPVVPIVRTHHERWDGLGYPCGLKGEAIPMGGRIISLVDVFDALTSERPYRKAITREKALEILRSNSGTQFDPRVVETFIELLPSAEARIRELEAEEVPKGQEILDSFDGRKLGTEAGPPEDLLSSARCDLLQAVAQDPSLIGFGARLAAIVAPVVPFASLTIYLRSRDGRYLYPAHTAGMWSELFDDMELRVGEGASGHLANTGESLRNVSASLDLARRVRPGDNLEVNSCLAVPLRQRGEITGVLTVYHGGYNFYQPWHQQFLEQAAASAAEAATAGGWSESNLPLPKGMQFHPDSGLYGLTQVLNEQLGAARVREEQVTLLMVDVSEYPELPDPRSPAEREQALQALGYTLQDLVRAHDYVARVNEARFAIVLPRCGHIDASNVVRRLQLRLLPNRLVEPTNRDRDLEVQFAVFPSDGNSGEALLAAALATFERGGARGILSAT